MKKLISIILALLLLEGAAGAQTLVIDAGHGGVDGGAVSADGFRESEINLSIAKKLEALAQFCGARTVMTREDENSVHSPEASTIREQKVSDLKNRVKLINSIEDAFLVSIHQNSFRGKSSGAQVFYGGEAMESAAMTQEYLRLALDVSNDRSVLPVPSGVYLFQNVKCGCVLVECGFMSDAREAELLRGENYQRKIAAAILAACLKGTKDEAQKSFLLL